MFNSENLQHYLTIKFSDLSQFAKYRKDKQSRKQQKGLFSLGLMTLSLLANFIISSPTKAGKDIYFQYGLLEFSITQKELETFAKTGNLEGSLETFLSSVNPKRREQLRFALQAKYNVDPVQVNRFSYTQPGKQLLTEMGELVQTQSGQNGFYALRGSLTLATADSQGLSLLNFIRQFPTDIRINVSRAFQIVDQLDQILMKTQRAITQMNHQTEEIVAEETAVNWKQLPDPRKQGKWDSSVQTFKLYDEKRDRAISTDIYLPESSPTIESIPLVVISNGLGADRTRFQELARHLASYGFAVATLDHPGSDRDRLEAFYQGLEQENFEATAYINRPVDISFLLDRLSRFNSKQFEGRLNLNQVGVFGYSFGGTTALALAGAEIDRDHLRQNCKQRLSLFNISLLYQCRALEVPPASVELQDDRIQAVYAFVPFSRSLYGAQGLAQVETPVFWEATNQDVLTPLVIEQLPSFCWLEEGNSNNQERNHYLAVTEKLPHARLSLNVLNRLTEQSITWQEVDPIAETYHKILSLVFFQVHLAQKENYRPYLHASGFQHLQESPYKINWGNQYCES